jgi:hypothetical protein
MAPGGGWIRRSCLNFIVGYARLSPGARWIPFPHRHHRRNRMVDQVSAIGCEAGNDTAVPGGGV